MGGVGVQGVSLLPGQVAATHGLEGDDDVRDLQVSLLLQVGQHPRAEEDLALPNPVQVGVELQGFDLGGRRRVPSLPGQCHPRLGGAGPGEGRAAHHENAGLLAVHEAFGNGVGRQDLVA